MNTTNRPSAKSNVSDLLEPLPKPEVQYLLAHPSEAVPAMLKRLDSQNGIRCDATHIAYFIVFKHYQDRRVLPALARFLDALPDSAGESASVPGSAFPYAIDAIKTLAPSALPSASNMNEMFRTRHQTATTIRTIIQAQSHEVSQRRVEGMIFSS